MIRLTQHIAIAAVFSVTLSVTEAVADETGAKAPPRASISWLDQDYPYLAVDQALPDVLRELGHNLDVAIEVSPRIEGRVRHHSHDGTAGALLDDLAREHRLDWVLDHGRLFLSSAEERTVRWWPGSAGAFEKAEAALTRAGLDDARFPLRYDAGRGAVGLSAPPKYLAMAAPLVERIFKPKATRVVNVIRGRSRAGGT